MHPEQAREKALRDAQAARYDEFFPPWRVRAETQALARAARAGGLARGGRLVDLGTGTGRVLLALLGEASSATGVDFSARSLEVARGKTPPREASRVEWREADVLATGLADASARVVTCAQVLQHLPDEAARDALVDEARRILAPDGRFVLTCYGRNLWHRLRGLGDAREGALWVFRHDPASLRRRLARAFRRVRVRPLVGLPDALGWPALDRVLSCVPGYGWVARTLLAVAERPR